MFPARLGRLCLVPVAVSLLELGGRPALGLLLYSEDDIGAQPGHSEAGGRAGHPPGRGGGGLAKDLWRYTRRALRSILPHGATARGALQRPVRVLTFGDSWAVSAPGPSVLRHMFDKHGVLHDIRAKGTSGSRACQWAANPNNLADAISAVFPDGMGVDFVWYVLGGNDHLGKPYTDCSVRAATWPEATKCIMESTLLYNQCTDRLLNAMWKRYPEVRVMQCGYDLACASPECFPLLDVPFCKRYGPGALNCRQKMTNAWQSFLLSKQYHHFKNPRLSTQYLGINILGASQSAYAAPSGGQVRPGHPDMQRGSPCQDIWMCVHPLPNSPSAQKIGDSFWNMYFKAHVPHGSAASVMPAALPAASPSSGVALPAYQRNLERELAVCLWDWEPSIRHPTPIPPQCEHLWKELTNGTDDRLISFAA